METDLCIRMIGRSIRENRAWYHRLTQEGQIERSIGDEEDSGQTNEYIHNDGCLTSNKEPHGIYTSDPKDAPVESSCDEQGGCDHMEPLTNHSTLGRSKYDTGASII
jgi:hypothetical protein